jgi:hypothetical protein
VTGIVTEKKAELPKDEPTVGSAFLFLCPLPLRGGGLGRTVGDKELLSHHGG